MTDPADPPSSLELKVPRFRLAELVIFLGFGSTFLTGIIAADHWQDKIVSRLDSIDRNTATIECELARAGIAPTIDGCTPGAPLRASLR